MKSVNPPSGFRDFLNDEARRRLKLMTVISDVYQSFGFSPLETPVMENLDILLSGGGGEENEKLIFRILKRGDKLKDALTSQATEDSVSDYGLRFDLTVPLSRAVAAHRGKIHLPWKVFHIGPVWRADRPQKGRFREFIQCDVDIIGAKGMGAEIEVIQAVVSAIQKVGAKGFELLINDRRLIQSMGEKLGFAGNSLEQFAIILDKKGKIDNEEILSQLAELTGKGISEDLRAIVEEKMTLDTAKEFHPQAVNDLQFIVSTLRDLQLPLESIQYDPSLVRGMGYYTGPVFELRHASAGYSFGGGGRYDKLIGRFSNQDLPAAGFSLGFERLALLLEESENKNELNSKSVFIPVFNENLRGPCAKIARDIRNAGLAVDLFPDQAKIKNQFKFASDSGYRWVLIAGEDELKSQRYKIKDFSSGQESEVNHAELIAKMKSLIGA